MLRRAGLRAGLALRVRTSLGTRALLRLLRLLLLARPAPLLLRALAHLLQERLVGGGVGGREPAGAVVLGERARTALVGTVPPGGALRPARDEPGDRPDEREEQDEQDPPDLGQVADLVVAGRDGLDDAVDAEDQRDQEEEQANHERPPQVGPAGAADAGERPGVAAGYRARRPGVASCASVSVA